MRTRVHRLAIRLIFTLVAITLFESHALAGPASPVFQSGNGVGDGTCYRIPSIIRAANGTLLAFAERRVEDCNDVGDIDIVLRRSLDDGTTWEPVQALRGTSESDVGYGNLVPVLDSASGRVSLMFARNEFYVEDGVRKRGTRTLGIIHSMDHGETWTTGTSLSHLKPAHWRWIALGPTHGVQKQHAPHVGRIIIAGDHTTASGARGAHVYHSDDGGLSWSLGATWERVSGAELPGETAVVERNDGVLYFNARSVQVCDSPHRRVASLSNDGGASFASDFAGVDDIHAPPVSAAMVNYYGFLLFSAPSRPGSLGTDRQRLSISVSGDGGMTWSQSGWVLREGPTGYSDMSVIGHGAVGVLYEHGNMTSHGNVSFQTWTGSDPLSDLRAPRTSDGSGNYNHSVVHGGAALASRGAGSALALDGNDDFVRVIDCRSSVRSVGDGDFTVMGWFNYSETSGARPIIWAYGQGNSSPQLWLRAEPAMGRIRGAINDGTSFSDVATSSAFNDGTWHHVAFRRYGNVLSIAIDGVTVAVSTGTAGDLSADGAFDIHIGTRMDETERYKGMLDDVRMVSRAVWDTELRSIMSGAGSISGEQLRLGFTSIWMP